MNLIAERRGHAVYVRCLTSPATYEAACECGFRSARTTEANAIISAAMHADTAAPFLVTKPTKKRKK